MRSLQNKPDVVEVRYECACGCKPRARYERHSDEAGYEHCCCGQVHFVGARAEERLRAYLAERAAQRLDAEVGSYTIHTQQVQAPWGEPVAVAYALPATPKQH